MRTMDCTGVKAAGARTVDCQRRAATTRRLIFFMAASLAALTLVAGGIVVAQSEDPAPGGGCEVVTSKVARPQTVIIGGTTRVTMTVSAGCDEIVLPIHAVMVVDNSLDVGGPTMRGLRDGVVAFAEAVDFSTSRVGLLTYHKTVDMLVELTDDPELIEAATSSFYPRAGSNLALGLQGAELMLDRGRTAGADGSYSEVVLVMAGSAHDNEDAEVLAVVDRLKARGVLVVTIAVGGAADYAFLEAMATSSDYFFIETSSVLFPELLTDVAGRVGAVHIDSALVSDRLPDNMELVWGSDVPPARPRDGAQVWRFDVWPERGIVITFELEPEELGVHPVSLGADVNIAFDRGAPASKDFDVPIIEVVPVPSVTPTSSATPPPTSTPTATPELLPLYMPLAIRNHCRPAARGADYAIVIDVSTSMLERGADDLPRLMSATLAASRFVDVVGMPMSRAALIAFSGSAIEVQRLTGSRSALQTHLAGLFAHVSTGSRLDLGLRAAGEALARRGGDAYPGPQLSAYSDAGRALRVVLLSDGRTPGGSALAEAEALRLAGAQVYAIGVGRDPNAELLEAIAGDASRYFEDREGDRLVEIFTALARDPRCP